MRVCDKCKTPIFPKNTHVILDKKEVFLTDTYSKIAELCDDCYKLLMDYIKGEQEEKDGDTE